MSGWLDVSVPTPALLLDQRRLEHNLDAMSAVVREHGVELLPHAKTHRMAEIGLLQVARGAAGLCVAKLGEAEFFAAAGIKRIFVAYPVVGDDKARRAVVLDESVDLTLGADSEAGAASVGRVFAAAGRTARVLLAIDTGLAREGVAAGQAVEVAQRIASIDGLELVGIYTHEGTVYEASDRADLEFRARTVAKTMVEIAGQIRARGIPMPVVSLGCSASARVVASVPGVTQLRPGIYAVNDLGQVALGNADLGSTAIRVVTTVVSHPEPGRACIDAGSKALSADLLPALAHRAAYPGLGLLVGAPGWIIERMSEEHGWLRWTGAGEPSALPIGVRIEVVPNHACMAFAMLRRVVVIQDGVVVDVWEGMGAGASE
ncbi:MAG: hypothetical protein QOF52_1671 [Propionibacteriaceae bacterium]|nr:hypothetical protein [Propionibacteriaceae bacterium]